MTNSNPITGQAPDPSQQLSGPVTPPWVEIAKQGGIKEIKVEAAPEQLPDLDYPPGFAGEIAQYLYHAAPRPVKEAAIAGALGLLAGVNGRYTVSDPRTGLNLMIALVMRSAMGKEAMHRITFLVAEACRQLPQLFPTCPLNYAGIGVNFVCNSASASQPAMTKNLARWSCYVDLVGELGQSISEMSEAKTGSPHFGLRTMLLKLSDKSGPDQVVSGINYSDGDKNVGPILGPCYSILGDTTPGTFYGSLDSSMSENGFISRWTIIECTSHIRPSRVKRPLTQPASALLGPLCMMVWAAVDMYVNNKRTHIACTQQAETELDTFDAECDAEINKTTDETRRAIYNRSLVKVFRIAGLLAVADHFHRVAYGPSPGPMIGTDHVRWAVALERRAIRSLTTRLNNGDIGSDDKSREDVLLSRIRRWIRSTNDDRKMQGLIENGIVPQRFLAQETSKLDTFRKHRGGQTEGLKQALRSLCDSGYVMEVQKDKLVENYNYFGKAYRILKLPD